MSYSARTVLGEEAVRLGIANAAAGDTDALDKLVQERAAQIVATPRQRSPPLRTCTTFHNPGLPWMQH